MAKQPKIPNFRPTNEAQNVFNRGMRQDTNFQFRKPESYNYSFAGRIYYSLDGDYGFTNEVGNLFSFQLKDIFGNALTNYQPIGFVEFPDKTLICSTNEVNSEVGYITIKSDGTGAVYTSIFNDKYDPNGDLFGWSLNAKMKKIIPDVENIFIERAYGADGTTELWVINTKIGLQVVSPQFTSGDYKPLAATGKYPWFYSVHSWKNQNDFQMGRLKFTGQISGAIKTGVVRITYRLLTRDGHITPWYPVGIKYFITLDPQQPVIPNNPSQFDRSMYASNVQTNIGMQFTVEGVDNRFYQIQYAYLYSIDENATVEAAIYDTHNLTPNSTTDTSNFVQMSGIPIAYSEFTVQNIPVKSVQTLEQKDGEAIYGNILTYGNYIVDTSTITIKPTLRDMVVDNIPTAAQTNYPFTNSSPSTTTVQLSAYTDKFAVDIIDQYTIVNDYTNYRGVQWEHLFTGYWRGETYRFAIVIFDLKGNPYYAQHIQDYTFPNQYDDGDGFALMYNAGIMSIMGVQFSNINLPKSILYDENGKLLASGYAIMRVPRVKKILCQGVILNTVITPKFSGGHVTDSEFTRPLPFCSNDFDTAEPFGTPVVADAFLYDSNILSKDSLNFANRPYTYTFHSPEISFQANIWDGTQQSTVNSNTDQLNLVEIYTGGSGDYGDATYPGVGNETPAGNNAAQFYTKNYQLGIDVGYNFTYSKGSTSRIQLDASLGFGSCLGTGCSPATTPYDSNEDSLTFFSGDDIQLPNTSFKGTFSAYGCRYSWLIQGLDYKYLNAASNTVSGEAAYYVANYIVSNSNYYGISNADTASTNQESLAGVLYQSTGHFQPITNNILNNVPQVTLSDGSTAYQFNNVEVWGGDCYASLFDFTRLYGVYNACQQLDYSVSMIIPLESNLNIALRYGRSFARDGVKPESVACNAQGYFPNGILTNQPEEFNLNSVLLFQEDIVLYPALQPTVNPNVLQFPYTWIYTPEKIAGEIYDSYVQFLAGNVGQVQGQYGQITGCFKSFNEIYSIQETGYGRLRIKDRSAISTEQGQALQTGLGNSFDGIDYISTHQGTRFPYSIVGNSKGFLFVDATNNCIIRHAQDGCQEITEIYDMKDWAQRTIGLFNNDRIDVANNIFEHIHGVYDNVRGEAIWTLISRNNGDLPDLQETIIFSNNEKLPGFTSFQPYIPYQYIVGNGYIFSQPQNNTSNQYIHYKGDKANFYGAVYDTHLKITINPQFKYNKKFDNFVMNVNDNVVDMLKLINLDTQLQHQVLDFSTFTKHDYSNGSYRFPIRPQPDRLAGHYLLAEFIFDNSKNEDLIFVSNATKWRYDRPIIV